MWGFEQVGLVLAQLERWDDERGRALPEQPVAKRALEDRLQPRGAVLRAKQPPDRPKSPAAGEDRIRLRGVQVHQFRRREARSEPGRDDAACGCAYNEVEVIEHMDA